ncbi:MAG: 6,7-dimethyl-8-ribityllumazine synthase [Burkholderiales bacterium]|nr:6,7-dimethyl-8-ribityllumazine synthase [Burkholderiales bacterium]
MNQPVSPSSPSSPPPRLAIVSAQWHADIVARARESAIDELARSGWPPDRVDCFEVPGSFEIPLVAQRLARQGRHAAIVACGLVVDGGIYRHDFVAAAVIDGLMRVQLDTGVPVLSVVLTPHAFHEHGDHRRFFGEHFVIKGREAAQAVLALLGVAPAA